MKTTLALVIAALIILSGCINISSEQKLQCSAAATITEGKIPKCESTQECSKKVWESLKLESFNESLLDSEISKWQSAIALNWHYYNKAKKALREIQATCTSNSQQELPTKLNELEFYLTKSFEAMDSANKASLAAISLQEARLRKQQIELTKEERLFDSLVELNEILNQSQNTSSKFLKKHFEANEEFEKLLQETGFQQKFETEITERDLLDEALPNVLQEVRPASIIVVLGKKAATALAAFLNNQEKTNDAISRLGKVSAEKTAKTIENFTGLENSTASEFYALMSKQKNQETILEKENEERIKQIKNKLKELKQAIESAEASEYLELDESFLTSLMQELGLETTIELRKTQFQTISEFQQNALKKQQELEARLSDEGNAKRTIGERTKNLKELEKETANLEKEITLVQEQMIGKTTEYCQAKASILQENVKELKHIQSIELEKIGYLENRIQETQKSQGAKQLLACKKMLQAFKDLKEKTTNKALFEETQVRKTQDCFKTIEEAVQNDNYQAIKERFEVLKQLTQAGLSGEKIAEECEKLKEQVFEEAIDQTKELEKKWVELNLLKNKLETITQNKAFVKIVEKRMQELQQYFNGEESILKAAVLKNELEKSIKEIKQELEKELQEQVIKRIQETAIIEITSEERIEANKPAKTKIRIFLESPENIEEETIINLPFAFENAVFLQGTNNAGMKTDNNSLILTFQSVEKGKTTLEFEAESIAATTEETMQNYLTTEEKAFFEKKIKIRAKENIMIPSLYIKTNILEGSKKISAVRNGASIECNSNGEFAEFKLREIKNKDEISVFFELEKPIQTMLELKEETQENNQVIQKFELRVKNNTRFELKKLKINLLLPTQAEQVKAFEEGLSEKTVEKKIDKFVLDEENILPFAEKKYSITVFFEKSLFDWQSIISQGQHSAEQLTLSENKEISEQAAELNERMLFWKENFSQNNTEHKKEVLGLVEKIKKLEIAEKNQEEEKAMLELQIIETEQKINEKTKETEEATANGFNQEATMEKIKKATEFLKEAKTLKNSSTSDSKKALEQANNLLVTDTSETKKELSERTNQLITQALESLKTFEKAINCGEEKQELVALAEKAREETSKGNFELAEQTLKELETKEKTTKENLMKKTKEIIENFLENAKNLEEGKQEIKKLTNKIEKNLEGINEKDLEEIQYLLPITKDSLAKIKLEASALISGKLEESIEQVSELKDQNQLLEAAELASKNKALIEEKSGKQEEISQKLGEAVSDLKEDAERELERTKQVLKNSAGKPAKATFLLEKAQNELEKENFLKSIQYTGYANALLIQNPEITLPMLPLSLVPLIAIIAIALFIKSRKRKEEKGRTKRIQRILKKSTE